MGALTCAVEACAAYATHAPNAVHISSSSSSTSVMMPVGAVLEALYVLSEILECHDGTAA